MHKLTFLLFVLFLGFNLKAQHTLTASDVVFTNGEITDYLNETEKDIIIPDNFNGVTVISIGDLAFYANQLSSVTIPNSVISIGDLAFDSNSLTSASIPNNVTSIGERAFANNQLINVTIPSALTVITAAAFYSNQLTSVTIPNSITSIGHSAFAKNNLTSIIIANSVTNIEPNAFYENELSGFKLPDHYDGFIYGWNGGNDLNSGDLVSDLTKHYTIGTKGAVFTEDLSTGLFEENKFSFSFYPNPSVDFIQTDLSITSLRIVNMEGVVIKKIETTNNVFNISDLGKGVYILQATSVNGIIYNGTLLKK